MALPLPFIQKACNVWDLCHRCQAQSKKWELVYFMELGNKMSMLISVAEQNRSNPERHSAALSELYQIIGQIKDKGEIERILAWMCNTKDLRGKSPEKLGALMQLHLKNMDFASFLLVAYEYVLKNGAQKLVSFILATDTLQMINERRTGANFKSYLEGAESINKHALDSFIEVIDKVYILGKKSDVLHIYEILISCGYVYNMAIVRLAESEYDKKNYHQAISILEDRIEYIGEWGICVYASAEAYIGNYDFAVKNFKNITSKRPEIDFFWKRFFEISLAFQEQDCQILNEFFSHLQTYRQGLFAEYELRKFVLFGNYQGISQYIERDFGLIAHLDANTLISYIQLMNKNEQAALQMVFFRHIFDIRGDDISIIATILNGLFDKKRWSDIAELLQRLNGSSLEDNLEIKVKRFELALAENNKEAMENHFRSLEPISQIPNTMLSAIYFYMAENRNWLAIINDFKQRVYGGYEGSGAEKLLIRAIRHTGSAGEMLDVFAECPNFSNSSSLLYIANIIVQDELYAKNNRKNEESRTALKVFLKNILSSLPERMIIEEQIEESRNASVRTGSNRYAFYFCTNDKYLCGAATALFSLLLNNPTLSNHADVFIIADDTGDLLALEVMECISEFFSIDVNFVYSETFINDKSGLRNEYGLMTGGVSLDKAAYYRIYFAKYLAQNFNYAKAVYFDSDMIINAGFLSALERIHSEKPLCARLEVDRPEVRLAIETHSLVEGCYFNSGFLLFNLQHKNIMTCLEKAVAAAENNNTRLLFQDQCALNIGFENHFDSLQENMNYFIAPNSKHTFSSEFQYPFVLHFLDRPKPWDAMNGDKLALVWLYMWQKLCEILPLNVSEEIYANAARS